MGEYSIQLYNSCYKLSMTERLVNYVIAAYFKIVGCSDLCAKRGMLSLHGMLVHFRAIPSIKFTGTHFIHLGGESHC